MRNLVILFSLLYTIDLQAQELYVYSEPASNMPTHSLSVRVTSNFINGNQHAEDRFTQRHTSEVMLGINKNWMWHVGSTFANFYTSQFQWESAYTYLKYRFLSLDEVHKHFRMAAFIEGTYSRNPLLYEELNFSGDKSGAQAGIISTQLWNKLALSGTVSFLQSLNNIQVHHGQGSACQAVNYSLSSGYLVLPFIYTNYRQTNMNIYLEMLAQQSLDKKAHYIDLASAMQFIFNSTSKLNISFRFQVDGNMQRMTNQSWLLGYEYTFLNAIKKKK